MPDVEKTAHSLEIAVNGAEIGGRQDYLVKQAKFSADVLTILSSNKYTLDPPPNPNKDRVVKNKKFHAEKLQAM